MPGDPIRKERVVNDATINSALSNRFVITGISVFEGAEARVAATRGLARGADLPDRGTHDRPEPRPRQHRSRRRRTLIGYLLVVIFIGLWYRVFGMLANIALFVNVIMIVAVMSLIPARR